MKKEPLRRFMERMIADEEFRRTYMANPDSVIREWEFSPEEVVRLEALIEQGASVEELDDRVSKYLFGGAGPG